MVAGDVETHESRARQYRWPFTICSTEGWSGWALPHARCSKRRRSSAVDYGLLRRVLPLSESASLDGLDDCLQAAVLEETPDGYRYRHGLLREAAYTRLSRARRQQLERTVAEALAAGDHAEPALVGAHFAQS